MYQFEVNATPDEVESPWWHMFDIRINFVEYWQFLMEPDPVEWWVLSWNSVPYHLDGRTNECCIAYGAVDLPEPSSIPLPLNWLFTWTNLTS